MGEFFVQLLGFTFLILGMMIYNNLIIMPLLRQHCFGGTDANNGNINQTEVEGNHSF